MTTPITRLHDLLTRLNNVYGSVADNHLREIIGYERPQPGYAHPCWTVADAAANGRDVAAATLEEASYQIGKLIHRAEGAEMALRFVNPVLAREMGDVVVVLRQADHTIGYASRPENAGNILAALTEED